MFLTVRYANDLICMYTIIYENMRKLQEIKRLYLQNILYLNC